LVNVISIGQVSPPIATSVTMTKRFSRSPFELAT